MKIWMCLGACALLAGTASACGGSDAGSTREPGQTNGLNGGAGTGGAGAGAGGTGSFGNPNGPAPNIGGGGDGAAGAAGDGACEVGMFCGPTNPDSDDCGSLTLEGDVETTVVPGNVLLVFDRSGSMNDDWNGMPRWQAAGTAIVDALNPIASNLTIGFVGFPSPDPNAIAIVCTVYPIEMPDQITFKPGPEALTELQTQGPGGAQKYVPVFSGLAVGATPTAEGVAAADMALAGSMLTGTTAVVLITDGEPNCGWNQQATVDTLTRWRTQNNILTYVVGLPGVGGNGPALLDALAQAGGTAPYLTPTNSAELQMKMNDIVESTVSVGFNSCSIALDPPAEVPDELHIVVTEPGIGEQDVPRDLGNGAGWTINAEGSQVELLGALCDNAMAGTYSALRFEYGCVELPPLVIEPPQ